MKARNHDIDIPAPGLCPSVTRWHCAKTAKVIVEILLPPNSPHHSLLRGCSDIFYVTLNDL